MVDSKCPYIEGNVCDLIFDGCACNAICEEYNFRSCSIYLMKIKDVEITRLEKINSIYEKFTTDLDSNNWYSKLMQLQKDLKPLLHNTERSEVV